MTKRFFISAILASVLTALLLGATALFAGGATAGTQPTTGNIAQTEGKQGSAKQPYGTWSDIAPLPTISVDEFYPCSPTPCTPQGLNVPARIKRGAGAAYPPNGKVYLFGGRHGLDGSEDFPLRWIFEYDPVADTWTQKSALLDGSDTRERYVANMAAGVLTDTNGVRIYVIGGSSIDSVPTPVVRVYDPVADSITDLTSTDNWPASPVHIPGGSAVYNNKMYLFGGFSSLGAGAVFTSTWQFDPMAPSGSRWTQLDDLNVPRGYIAGAVVDGKLYAIGGDTWDTANRLLVPTDTVEMMDLTQPSPTWVPVESLPSARGDLKAWAYDTGTNYEISGKVMVAGGPYPVPDASAYLYDPTTNSWSSAPDMVHATRNYAAAQLNGYLYAIGGYDYSDGVPNGANFVQRYDGSQPPGTPTVTPTGTLPTATRTSTRTNTPTVTPTLCSANYAWVTGTATIMPGTTDTGNHGDDEITSVSLPFPVIFYGHSYNSVIVSSNGNAQFVGADNSYQNECLYSPVLNDYSVSPYWDDLRTDGSGEGIFTAVTGSAPNRTLYIEWRTEYYDGGGTANFEVVLHENVTNHLEFIYGTVSEGNSSSTIGMQKSSSVYAQYACDGTGGAITPDLLITWTQVGCPTLTPSPIVTSTLTATSTPTSEATDTATSTPVDTQTAISTETAVSTDTPVSTETEIATETVVATETAISTETSTAVLPTETPTACTIEFTDVGPDDTFYADIMCLACRGIINGYDSGCDTGNPCFRPGNFVTRGQLAKIVSNSAGFDDDPGPQAFEDVPPGSTFYDFIGRLGLRGIINGYPCGGPGEPCGTGSLPYFRPSANITRGQISKIVSEAAGYSDAVGDQQFEDVEPGSTFYDYIWRLTDRGIMQGYPCGGVGEPCVDPGDLPYFRPSATATRGQASKITANTFFPGCDTP